MAWDSLPLDTVTPFAGSSVHKFLHDLPTLPLAELVQLVRLVANVLALVPGAYPAVQSNSNCLSACHAPPTCAEGQAESRKICTETAVFVQSIRHRVSSSVFVPGDSDCREGFCAVSHDCAVDQEHEAPLPLPAAITSAKER